MDGKEVSVVQTGDVVQGPMDGAAMIMSFESTLRQALNNGTIPIEMQDALEKTLRKLNIRSAVELRRGVILADFTREFDFIKVDALKHNSEMCVWFKPKDSTTYKPFTSTTALELIATMYRKHTLDCTEQEAQTIRGMIKIKEWPHVGHVDDSVIRVSSELYWDRTRGRLIRSMSEAYDYEYAGIFRELFDNVGCGNSSINEFSIDQVHISPEEVTIISRYLAGNKGAFPKPDDVTPLMFMPIVEDFDSEAEFDALAPLMADTIARKVRKVLDVMWVWANNESVDTMNDILKVYTYPFLKELPKRFFIFDGDRRNGKSSCISLLETIIGFNNCSELPMKSLLDPHMANSLVNTWVNAAREDFDFNDSDMKEGIAFLKCVATHETVTIQNFYTQSDSKVVPRFLPIFSRNGTPDFGNVEGTSAIMTRMRAIRFKNDLSSEDNSGKNFEKETYTPEFCSTTLTMVLAMAQYFNVPEHEFDLSETSKTFGTKLEAITDPATFFLNELSKWFDYVGTVGFVTKQAEKFFNNQGYDWNGEVMRAIKAKLIKMDTAKVEYPGHNGRRRCIKLPLNKHRPNRLKMFAEDAIMVPLGNKTPEEYYKSLNHQLSNMDTQSAYDYKVPSIIEALQEFEDDESHGTAANAQLTLDKEL